MVADFERARFGSGDERREAGEELARYTECEDHMVPCPDGTGNGNIQGFGGIAGEDHMIRPLASEQGRDLAPGVINHPGG